MIRSARANRGLDPDTPRGDAAVHFLVPAARADSVKQEFGKAVEGPLDQLVREIAAYK